MLPSELSASQNDVIIGCINLMYSVIHISTRESLIVQNTMLNIVAGFYTGHHQKVKFYKIIQ